MHDCEPVMHDYEPVVNDYEPVMDDYVPVMDDYVPVMDDCEPVVRDYEPVVNDCAVVMNGGVAGSGGQLRLTYESVLAGITAPIHRRADARWPHALARRYHAPRALGW